MSSGKLMHLAFRNIRKRVKEEVKKNGGSVRLGSKYERKLYRQNLREHLRLEASKAHRGKGEITANQKKREERAYGVNRKKKQGFNKITMN